MLHEIRIENPQLTMHKTEKKFLAGLGKKRKEKNRVRKKTGGKQEKRRGWCDFGKDCFLAPKENESPIP